MYAHISEADESHLMRDGDGDGDGDGDADGDGDDGNGDRALICQKERARGRG
jgi:hypothetical protein